MLMLMCCCIFSDKRLVSAFQWRSKQEQVYSPVVPWTAMPPFDEFSDYLHDVPEPYRCTDYVKVAHLLLGRYSAGGFDIMTLTIKYCLMTNVDVTICLWV